MRDLFSVPIAVLLLFATVPSEAQMRAFPGAEGFGSQASGGRGGDMYIVTNRNNSGAGSFREAFNYSGTTPRTIVFEVGGTIDLDTRIRVQNKSNITIAGQTAPGGGILIRGDSFSLEQCTNVIVRHIRVRHDAPDEERDTIAVSNSTNIILDHVSASWGRDETISLTGESSNITVQNSIIAEGVRSDHQYGSLINSTVTDGRMTLWRNLYINQLGRTPRAASQNGQDFLLENVNNVVYNWGAEADWGSQSCISDNERGTWNMINNVHIAGPSTTKNFIEDLINNYSATILRGGAGDDSAFLSGNTVDSNRDGTLSLAAAGWSNTKGGITQLGSAKSVPEWAQITAIQSPAEALATIIADAGCTPWNRDSVDTRLITELQSYGTQGSVKSSTPSFPSIATGTAPSDTDRDGMPNDWETWYGTDPAVKDHNTEAPNGYTAIENYLQWAIDEDSVDPLPGEEGEGEGIVEGEGEEEGAAEGAFEGEVEGSIEGDGDVACPGNYLSDPSFETGELSLYWNEELVGDSLLYREGDAEFEASEGSVALLFYQRVTADALAVGQQVIRTAGEAAELSFDILKTSASTAGKLTVSIGGVQAAEIDAADIPSAGAYHRMTVPLPAAVVGGPAVLTLGNGALSGGSFLLDAFCLLPGDSAEGEGEHACPAGNAADTALVGVWNQACTFDEWNGYSESWTFNNDGTFTFDRLDQGDEWINSGASGTYTVNTAVTPHEIDIHYCEACIDDTFDEFDECDWCCEPRSNTRLGIYSIDSGLLSFSLHAVTRPVSIDPASTFAASPGSYCSFDAEGEEGEIPVDGEEEVFDPCQNLIVEDASFESANLSTHWNDESTGPLQDMLALLGESAVDPLEGFYALRFIARDTDDVHAIGQTVTLAAGSYELTLHARRENAEISGSITIALGETLFTPVVAEFGGVSEYQQEAFSFEVESAGDYLLVLGNPALSGGDVYIDNVCIHPALPGEGEAECQPGGASDPALLGTWQQECYEADDTGYEISWTFRDDGTFTRHYSYTSDEQNPDVSYGTYAVDTSVTPRKIDLHFCEFCVKDIFYEFDCPDDWCCTVDPRTDLGIYSLEAGTLSFRSSEARPDSFLPDSIFAAAPATYCPGDAIEGEGECQPGGAIDPGLLGTWQQDCYYESGLGHESSWTFREDGTFTQNYAYTSDERNAFVTHGTYAVDTSVTPYRIDFNNCESCFEDITEEFGCAAGWCFSVAPETVFGIYSLEEGMLNLRTGDDRPDSFLPESTFAAFPDTYCADGDTEGEVEGGDDCPVGGPIDLDLLGQWQQTCTLDIESQ